MPTMYSLLSLPQTSTGFSSIRATVIDSTHEGSRRDQHRAPIKVPIIGSYVAPPINGSEPFALVKRCISIILTKDTTDVLPATYEGIYNACRAVVTVANNGEGLYQALKLELEKSMGRTAKELSEASAADGIDYITYFVSLCEWFESEISLLRSLLTFLDQVYVLNNPKHLNIRNLAYSLFSDRVFENPRIAIRLRKSIADWVTWERNLRLEHDGRAQIPLFLGHILAHKQYSAFEEYYVKITQDFYTNESAKSAESMKNNPMAFFKHAHLRIEEEIQRSKTLFPVGSWAIIRETTERALWTGRVQWLSNGTLGPYMNVNDTATLATMYALFSRVDGVKALCSAFRAHIQVVVQKIVMDAARDDEMVQRLLDLKALADTTISSAFVDEPKGVVQGSTTAPPPKQPNHDFIYALSDSFAIGFKARRNKPAEMIAKFLDKTMRRGQGGSSDAAFEALLDSALALYRFTDDKDVFRTFYHRALAKRLLLEKSASDDFEVAMLKKLKEQYDPEFGMGEDMFKDLALSRESMRDYHSRLGDNSPACKLHVMVLQRSAWPFAIQKMSLDLPPNMQADLTAYTDFYKHKHSGHTLDWDHALGTATLIGRFKPGDKELSVSLYQAIVLLLFNETAELRFPDIANQTRMDDGELRRTLQSLACGKKKVLRKIPPGRDINDEDTFRFNASFEDPRPKVHINSIQAKVTPEESRRTQTSIEGDRKHYLDAAIVRVMKARKEMTYEQLKAATIDAVKNHFVPQVDVIKKRIDSLVETDYLERSKKDRNTFLYVA
ncbi:Cullin-4B [Infundibulicybe gibba]|nr:Cullin-4B [Infundibulicybe gibba]